MTVLGRLGCKQREETNRGPGKEQNIPAMLTIAGATSIGPSRTPLALNSFASRTCTVRTGIQAHVQQNPGLHRHSSWDKAQPKPWAQEIARSLNRFRQHLQTAGNDHRGLCRSSCTVLVQWPEGWPLLWPTWPQVWCFLLFLCPSGARRPNLQGATQPCPLGSC